MPEVDRRAFLAGALAVGAAATLPFDLLLRAASVSAAAGSRFLTVHEHATCDAICSRIVPTDGDPGAHEAGAVDFIDLFLAAFELPSSLADNPAIYLHGRYSGRNPYPDPSTGRPSATSPASDFVDPVTGQRHFLSLDTWQDLGWRAVLYGASVLVNDQSLPKAFRDRVADGTNPVPSAGLRDVYRNGLAAFDSFAQREGQTDFASSPNALQDAMLMSAGNVALGPVFSNVFGNVPLPVPATPPPAAVALYVPISIHTFQACYGLPEYGSRGGPPFWSWIHWDGDTQPLGNSIYDATLTDAQIAALGGDQGRNAGYGDSGQRPSGGYREYREVSTNAHPGPSLPAAELAPTVAGLRRLGVLAAPRRSR